MIFVEHVIAPYRKDPFHKNLCATFDAMMTILNDPRVRALFPPLPDGAILASCSGDEVHKSG